MSPDATLEHNALYKRATELATPYILTGTFWLRPAGLGLLGRWKLNRSLSLFDVALRLWPDNWAARWMQAKVFQRLGRHEDALRQFDAAHHINPSQVDVVREAGIEAIAVGDGPAAIRFCQAAIALRPADAGLASNLAIALLINGRVEEAQRTAESAVVLAPGDAVSKTVLRVIKEVASGRRPVPKRADDIR